MPTPLSFIPPVLNQTPKRFPDRRDLIHPVLDLIGQLFKRHIHIRALLIRLHDKGCSQEPQDFNVYLYGVTLRNDG